MRIIPTASVGLCASLMLVSPCAQEHMQNHSIRRTVVHFTAKNDATEPAPQLERLICSLAGEWSTEENYEPSDLLPKGGKGHSTDSYRPGPGRLSLIEEYKSEGDAGESSGIGIIWWDGNAERFSFVWCDSFALDRGCRVSSQSGRWERNSYVETDEHTVDGKRVLEKEVWSDFTPNSFIQTLYVGDAPDHLRTFLTIKAERVSSPSRKRVAGDDGRRPR
jgi:hypothetical protein